MLRTCRVRAFATASPASSRTLRRPPARPKSTRSASMDSGKFKFAGIQLDVGKDKDVNLKNARAAIDEAAKAGAKFISLPVRRSIYLLGEPESSCVP